MKNKVKIKLITIGSLKHDLNLKKITQHKSKILKIDKEVQNIELLPDAYDRDSNTYEVVFKKEKLKGIVKGDCDCNITVGIIDYRIEDNFYMRRLSDNVMVISIMDIPEILEMKDIPIENFILKCIYEAASFYVFSGNKTILNADVEQLIHGETRRCLYDMNGDKNDVAFSTEKMCFCDGCKAELKKLAISVQNIESFESEIKKIKPPLYVLIKRFFKKHTIASIILSLLLSIVISMTSCLFYDLLKYYVLNIVLKSNFT